MQARWRSEILSAIIAFPRRSGIYHLTIDLLQVNTTSDKYPLAFFKDILHLLIKDWIPVNINIG